MLSQGLRGFLPKPYTQEKLLTQVRSTLDAIRIQNATSRPAQVAHGSPNAA
jgi:FixJ family two-component response regulator